MTRELLLIGIGAGDPDWLTLEAVRAIQALDVAFVVTKQNHLDDLVAARHAVVRRHRGTPLRIVELRDPPRPWRTAADYPAAVAHWRAQRAELWGGALNRELGAGQIGGFLVWGDPSLYESTLAIATELVDRAADSPGEPLSLRVIPGISAVHALTARHRIPLNRQGHTVTIAPGRLLRDGVPADVDDVVVMLDSEQVFATIDPAGLDIYWGAYLGTPDETLIAGRLADVRDEIRRVRAECAARKGWVFDTYLLRKHHRVS